MGPYDYDDWEITGIAGIYFSKKANKYVFSDEAEQFSDFFPSLGHAVSGLNWYVNNVLNWEDEHASTN